MIPSMMNRWYNLGGAGWKGAVGAGLAEAIGSIDLPVKAGDRRVLSTMALQKPTLYCPDSEVPGHLWRCYCPLLTGCLWEAVGRLAMGDTTQGAGADEGGSRRDGRLRFTGSVGISGPKLSRKTISDLLLGIDLE